MKTAEVGNNVKVHYKGTLIDGTEFDSSHSRNEPLSFEVGSTNIIKGFSDAVIGMSEGQTKTVTLTSENAYGSRQPDAVQRVPKQAFGENFQFVIGETVQGNGPNGRFLATIQSLEGEEVLLDMNHPLAGKDLTFEIQLLNVESNATLTNLTKLKLTELRAVAKERGLRGYTKLKKTELLDLLSA